MRCLSVLWDHDTAVFVENVPSFHWYFSLIGSIWQYCSVFIVLCLSVCCFCKIFLAVLANALSGQVDILEHLELFSSLRTLHSVACMKPPVCVSVEYGVWIVSICWAGVICSLYLLCSFDLSLEYHRIWTSSFVIHYIREVAPLKNSNSNHLKGDATSIMSWWG